MRRVLAPLAAAAAAALVVAAALHVAATGLSGDLVVTPPGGDAGPVTLGAAVAATGVASLGTMLLAVVCTRFGRPRAVFTAVGAGVLLASLASPVGAAHAWDTAAWLSVMHVAVTGVLVGTGAVVLPGRRAGTETTLRQA